jgi:hypothetical protein
LILPHRSCPSSPPSTLHTLFMLLLYKRTLFFLVVVRPRRALARRGGHRIHCRVASRVGSMSTPIEIFTD